MHEPLKEEERTNAYREMQRVFSGASAVRYGRGYYELDWRLGWKRFRWYAKCFWDDFIFNRLVTNSEANVLRIK